MAAAPSFPEPPAAEARRVFLAIAALTGVLWILIAAGINGERDGDSRAWLTCFTFWAPASYLLVVGRRSWTRRMRSQALIIAAASVVAIVETLSVAAHRRAAPSAGPSIADRLPAPFGIAFFYGMLGSLFAAPILSLVVFLEG